MVVHSVRELCELVVSGGMRRGDVVVVSGAILADMRPDDRLRLQRVAEVAPVAVDEGHDTRPEIRIMFVGPGVATDSLYTESLYTDSLYA
jgi:hypothetical protein